MEEIMLLICETLGIMIYGGMMVSSIKKFLMVNGCI